MYYNGVSSVMCRGRRCCWNNNDKESQINLQLSTNKKVEETKDQNSKWKNMDMYVRTHVDKSNRMSSGWMCEADK